MAFNFHNYKPLSEQIHARLLQSRPECRAQSDVLARHFMQVAPAAPDYAGLCAILSLLVNEDLEQATHYLSNKTGKTTHQSRSSIMQAINDGPAEWPGKNDFLYECGIMKGISTYYAVPRELYGNSLLKDLSRRVDPAFRAFFNMAVECTLTSKTNFGLRIYPPALLYVAAQLIPAGTEQDIAIDKLSMSSKDDAHQKNLERSVAAIRGLAVKTGTALDALRLIEPELTPARSRALKKAVNKAVNPTLNPTEADITRKAFQKKVMNYLVPLEISSDHALAYCWIKEMVEKGMAPSNFQIYNRLKSKNMADAVAFEGRVDGLMEQAEKRHLHNELILKR